MSSTSTIFRPAPRIVIATSEMVRSADPINAAPESVFGVDFLSAQMLTAELNGEQFDVLNSEEMQDTDVDGQRHVVIKRGGTVIVDERVDVVHYRQFALTYEPEEAGESEEE